MTRRTTTVRSIRSALSAAAAALVSLWLAAGCRPTPPPVVKSPGQGDAARFAFDLATQRLAITSTYHNGAEAGQNAILESLGGGVGILDYDRDGKLDLCFPGGGGLAKGPRIYGHPSTLWRQNSAGRMTNVSASAGIAGARHYSHGIAAADYDNDGFSDLLITGYGGVTLWHNQGDGTFADETAAAGLGDQLWSSSAGWGDVDGDGTLDLYLAHYVNWSWDNHPRCPGPRADTADVCPPRQFDGLPDTLYFAVGDGTFRDGSQTAGLRPEGKGLGVLLADVDHDRDLDIYVANDTTDNFLYINDGSGRLSETGMSSGTAVDDRANPNGSMGLALTDFDGDQLPELWVTNYEDETFALYRNQGSAQFMHVSAETGVNALGRLLVGFGTVAGDFDADGDEDLAVANGHVIHHPRNAPVKQEPLLLMNQAHQRLLRVAFPAQSYFATPHAGRGLAQGDLDDDGDLDLVFANSNEPAAVLLNRTVTSGGSLRIRLIGTVSNRDGLGSRLILRTSSGTQLRHVYGGGSYLSTSDLAAHFGIPAESTPEHLQIHWPSGAVTEVDLKRNPPPAGELHAAEPHTP